MSAKYKILIIVFLVILVTSGGLLWRSTRGPSDDQLETQGRDETILCAQDVRQCSDGTLVGRVAPACDFALCPDGSEATASAPVSEDNSTTTTATTSASESPQLIQ